MTDSFLRPSFTLEQIRTFLAVASREHITNAAQVLNLSQPAVTQQLQLLERALGVQLLERVGRAVRLTNTGAEVAGACLLIMRALENLDGVVQAVRSLDLGAVTVGASQFAATYFLPATIAEFSASYPRISLDAVVSEPAEICRQVSSGRLECGLVEEDSERPSGGLLRTRVAEAEVVLVANPRHPGLCDGSSLPDVMHSARYLVWGPGSAIEGIDASLLGEHYTSAPRLHIGSIDAARRLLLTSPGFVAAMPAVAVQDDLSSGMLTRLCAEARSLAIYAVRRQGPDSPAIEALWKALVRRRSTTDG